MKNRRLLVFIAATVCLAVVGAGIFFVYKAYFGTEAKLKKQLELANKYLLEQNYEEAIAAFNVAISIDKSSEEAYIGLAEIYGSMAEAAYSDGNADGCLEYLNKALDILEQGMQNTESELIKQSYESISKRIDEVSQEQEEKRRREEEEKIAAEMREKYAPVYEYTYSLGWTEVPTLDSLTGVSVRDKGWKCVSHFMEPFSDYDFLGDTGYTVFDYNEMGFPASFGNIICHYSPEYSGNKLSGVTLLRYDFMASFESNSNVYSPSGYVSYAQDGLAESFVSDKEQYCNTYTRGDDGRILSADTKHEYQFFDGTWSDETNQSSLYEYDEKGLLTSVFSLNSGDSYSYEYEEINYLNCVTKINKVSVGKHDYEYSYSFEYDEEGYLKKMIYSYNLYDDEWNEENDTILDTYTNEYSFGDYRFPENPTEGSEFSVPVTVLYGETGEQNSTELKYKYSSEW